MNILIGLPLIALIIFVIAIFQGTILYFIWPVVMVNAFHLPALGWWQAVCLTWICNMLIKSDLSKPK